MNDHKMIIYKNKFVNIIIINAFSFVPLIKRLHQSQNASLSTDLKTKEQQPIELLERINVLNGEVTTLKEKLLDAETKLKEMPNLLKLENDLAQTRVRKAETLFKFILC